MPNFAVQRLALLPSYSGGQSFKSWPGYRIFRQNFFVSLSVPPSNRRDSTLNRTTAASARTVPKFLYMYPPAVRCYIIWVTGVIDAMNLSLAISLIILINPSGNFTYHRVKRAEILHGSHNSFMRFVWISEQTATFTLYSIKWLGFVTGVESVYRAVRTETLIYNRVPFVFKELTDG
jgi:hypothetical protein